MSAPADVLWDVGAGSGSVGIEAALGMPEGEVYAVERDATQIEHIHENRVRFRTPQVESVEGAAPAALTSLLSQQGDVTVPALVPAPPPTPTPTPADPDLAMALAARSWLAAKGL